MDIIRSSVNWKFHLTYLDGIVVFWLSRRDHTTHVRQALSLLQDVGITLKLKKCNVFTRAFDYFSIVIPPQRLEIAAHTTNAIIKLKPSSNITEFFSFLALCNVFRRFASIFTWIEAPPSNKLKKDQPKRFSELRVEELSAMHKLQENLLFSAILGLRNASKKHTLDTDSCNAQVKCVLLQEQSDGTTKPVGY